MTFAKFQPKKTDMRHSIPRQDVQQTERLFQKMVDLLQNK